jgi:GAF domain-containing protein
MRVADRVIGTFNLTSTTAAVFDSDDLALAEQLATFLAVALENARMYAQAADRVSIEQLSSQLTGQQQGDIQALFLNTLREVGETLNARVGRIRLQMPTVEAVDVAKLRKLFDSGTFGKRFKLADMVKPETDPHHPHLQKPAPGESGTPSEQG